MRVPLFGPVFEDELDQGEAVLPLDFLGRDVRVVLAVGVGVLKGLTAVVAFHDALLLGLRIDRFGEPSMLY
jgi:hypothetical protein